MSKRFNWLGVLLIATVSGLIVKVVGDPITAVTTPKIEDFLEDIEDFFEDFEDRLEDMNLWQK
jgi:biopolymer transport protein ExbB/TolQ